MEIDLRWRQGLLADPVSMREFVSPVVDLDPQYELLVPAAGASAPERAWDQVSRLRD